MFLEVTPCELVPEVHQAHCSDLAYQGGGESFQTQAEEEESLGETFSKLDTDVRWARGRANTGNSLNWFSFLSGSSWVSDAIQLVVQHFEHHSRH